MVVTPDKIKYQTYISGELSSEQSFERAAINGLEIYKYEGFVGMVMGRNVEYHWAPEQNPSNT